MKSQSILFAALAIALAACDDYNDNFEGLDELVSEGQTNVMSGVSYELTESDYSTIAGYTADNTDEAAELAKVKSAKAFPSEAIAQKYLAKFVAKKWYTADKGSAVTITYKLSTDAPEYISQLASAKTYELTSDDYSKIWNGTAKAQYLTKSTVASIPALLPTAISDAQSGDYVLVTYKYSDSEPSSSASEAPECHWTKLSGAQYPTGSSWSYVSSGNVDLSAYAGQTIRLALRYQSTTSLAGTVEVKNLKVGDASVNNYVLPTLFALQDDGSYALASSFAGAGKYLVLAKDGASYYAFGKIKDGKAYGYSTSDPVTVTDNVVSAADAASIFVEFEASSKGFNMKNADGSYLYMKGTYDSFNSASSVGDEGYDWTVTVSDNGVSIANVDKAKTIHYDTKYSSYGSYADSKLGIIASNSLLSSTVPDGYFMNDVTLPAAASYVWTMTEKYGVKASAYINKTNYESESWFVTAEIDLSSATSPYVSVDWAANYFSGNDVSDYLGIYVSTDYEEGADFTTDGNKSLKAATDNSETKLALYSYDGTSWSEPSDILVVNPSDYTAMGISASNFSSSNKPATYLAQFFGVKLPYAQEGDKAAAVYYYNSDIEAAEYTYSNNAWAASATYTTTTGQFVRSSSWMYDPCVTINLPYDRSDATAKAFYQAVTDWVWENIDVKLNKCENKGEGYVTSYGNNEYYTGSSAYYNNVDWRASKASDQSSAYDGMTDEQIFEQLQQNLITTYAAVLGVLYPNADLVDGVDVIYTINFVAYYSKENNGSNAGISYTIAYRLTAKGTFEYVEDSLQEVE